MTHEAKIVADLTTIGLEIKNVSEHPFVITPDNFSVQSLEKFLPAPLRVQESINLTSDESFITYVNDYKTSETRLFASLDNLSIGAYLDYHTPEKASWKGHKAFLKVEKSNEWETWISQNNKMMNQVEFSEFIENNLADVHAPSGATLLEIIRTLEMKRDVTFKSHINLTNGNHQFTFNEEDSAVGKIEIPSEITLSLPIFKHGVNLGIRARVRYRLRDGKVQFCFIIDQPHKVVEAAFKEVVQKIIAGIKITPLYT